MTPRRFLAGRLDAPAERRPRARQMPAAQRRQRVLHILTTKGRSYRTRKQLTQAPKRA